eukprot:PhM_4_TR8414/c1_g1_i1/m.8218
MLGVSGAMLLELGVNAANVLLEAKWWDAYEKELAQTVADTSHTLDDDDLGLQRSLLQSSVFKSVEMTSFAPSPRYPPATANSGSGSFVSNSSRDTVPPPRRETGGRGGGRADSSANIGSG